MDDKILSTAPPPTPEAFREYLVKLANELGEHCDSVRILCTLPTEGGITAGVDAGFGSIYAQIGHVQEWLTIQDQYVRNHAIRKDAKDND